MFAKIISCLIFICNIIDVNCNTQNTIHIATKLLKNERKGGDAICTYENTPNSLDTYWINLDRNIDRKTFMDSQLTKTRLNNLRISAISPNSTEYILELLERPCKRNTPKDLAVVMSHLKAVHTAVHSPLLLNSSIKDYALILEDDVKILYDIDFKGLIASAPPDFGILQLVTSNVEAIHSLYAQFGTTGSTKSSKSSGGGDQGKHKHWRLTAWNHFTKNGKTSLYWSAQAYIVNRRVVRPFLDDVTSFDQASGRLGFRLVNSFFPDKCKRTRARPCVLANCLFADSYIFAGGGPTYVSTLPLFGGSRVGVTSTLHQEQVGTHQEAFALIRTITSDLKQQQQFRGSNTSITAPQSLLPSFLRHPVCAAAIS